ncbi:MAG: hypothetical protein P8Y00_00265 [Deltaproteobacteria bacterium]
MRETFEQLINRLSRYEGLYWMNSETCPDKETSIKAVRDYIRTFEIRIPDFWRSNSANCALKEILDFGCGVPTISSANSQYYSYSVDWGDTEEILSDFAKSEEIFSQPDETPRPCWQSTEQDYRECCGVWVTQNGHTQKYGPVSLRLFESSESFDRFHEDDVRIEPMPEQCVPKAEPEKESYQIKFPLLAGILE